MSVIESWNKWSISWYRSVCFPVLKVQHISKPGSFILLQQENAHLSYLLGLNVNSLWREVWPDRVSVSGLHKHTQVWQESSKTVRDLPMLCVCWILVCTVDLIPGHSYRPCGFLCVRNMLRLDIRWSKRVWVVSQLHTEKKKMLSNCRTGLVPGWRNGGVCVRASRAVQSLVQGNQIGFIWPGKECLG